MKLTPMFLDFESFWDTDHTLTKMSPMEYVMSPKTEIISLSIKAKDYPTDVFFGEDAIRKALHSISWDDKMAIGHNMSGFDSMILKWRFGVQPKMWGCTAAMARSKYAKTCGVSLAKLVQEFGFGEKNAAILHSTKGKRLADFTDAELLAMAHYNRMDTEQCAMLFTRLAKGFPRDELVLIHLTTQMLVNPKFVLDKSLVETALSVERDQKRKALLELAKMIRLDADVPAEFDWSDEDAVAEFVRSEMASAARFSKLLESCQVEVPMKPSPTNPLKMTPALAKTDDAFLKLQEHSSPLVAAAARVRLSVKSTLLETRLQAFLRAAEACNGRLPVPLKYCGADTTGRWSGEQYNCMTEGHEVLTPVGWVDIKDWTPELPIMQWWPDGSASWDEAAKKVEYDHDGPVAVLDGPFTKGVFTLDHRVPSIRGKRRTVKDYTAGWVAEHSGLDGVPAAGVYVGGPGTFSPDQTRLLVATSADATVTDTEIRWGFRRRRKIDRIMRLFADCGLTDLVRVYDNRGKPGGHWVAVLLRSRAPSWLRKGFGPWLLGLSRESLDALVDELPHWGGSKHSRTGNTCFYASQADQAEWVSTALHLSGKPARVGRRADNKLDVYARGTVTTSATGRLSTFKGRVYCPQVASGYVFVRYAGSIHVTGNCQNLPRIGPKPKTSDALRNSLKAPPGHKVVVADLSGIELRVNHFLWKVEESMELYQQDAEADLYRAFAAARYGITPDEVTEDQRQLAKVAQLGLGFGAGAATFRKVAKLMGGLELSEEEAAEVVESWRATYHRITTGWRICHAALSDIRQGIETPIDPWGMCVTEYEAIRLPSGRRIHYPSLRQERDDKGKTEWWYGEGRHKARIYAGKIDENIVQALARDVMADISVRLYKLYKFEPCLLVHDEYVMVLPEREAESGLRVINDEMRKPPKWWPELILHSKGGIGDSYGQCK